MNGLHRFTRNILAPMLWLAVLAAASSVAADEESDYEERHDHDQVRQAVERGEALPLDAVLAVVEKEVVGEIVGIEFEKSQGVWVYEFKVVDAAGHVIEVLADAKTAAIIRVEGE